ncbi:MAG: enoyl-CoA hydratase [Chloroflexi bacterium]|nr:enoyl-CoA hydratase [Chloroflexota bacterium]
MRERRRDGVFLGEPVLLVETANGVTTVTLNRPKAMNALSWALRNAITEAFIALRDDASTDVVVLTGAGRAFSAGLDLKELGGESGDAGGAARAASQADMVDAITGFDRPIIGAINGVAITGGFELALACDLLLASTEARFADTHARVGIMPGWGLSQKLGRIIGITRAKELSLTGNYLSGTQAEAWGLVSHCVAPEELMPLARQLASDMQSCAPGMLPKVKRVMDEGYRMTLAEGLQFEKTASRIHMDDVTPDMVRGRRLGIQERGREQQRHA